VQTTTTSPRAPAATQPPATKASTTTAPPATTAPPTTKASTTTAPPTTTGPAANNYAWHNGIKATWFYVGEPADASNAYIQNTDSAWQGGPSPHNWRAHYGGTDSPSPKRTATNGYQPTNFTPKENPFYCALPYNDFDANGNRRSNAKQIPWYTALSSDQSVVKNRWIEVRYNGKSAFCQWEDVGPMNENDFDYVFGTAAPSYRSAGIDLSPATRDFLGAGDVTTVDWRFADAPATGPWTTIVTRSQTDWG
jgi:hypothetical protein